MYERSGGGGTLVGNSWGLGFDFGLFSGLHCEALIFCKTLLLLENAIRGGANLRALLGGVQHITLG